MKLGAVVVAAGLSRRMGREKVLLSFGESSVLERILTTLAVAAISERVVVLRTGLSEAQEQARRAGARVVLNRRPREEMLLSIRLGIAALALDVEAFYVWPADHPAVAPETLVALGREAAHDRAILPTYQDRRGHPALIGAGFLEAIGRIPPGKGLRHLWHAHPEILREIPVEDRGILLDLDTPEDYENALGQRRL